MPADRIDLYEVVAALRRSAPLLAAAMLAGAILVGAITWFALPYTSDGMYGLGAIVKGDVVVPNQPPLRWPKSLQFGKGLSLPELKVEYPRLDGEEFRRFLASRNVVPDATLERLAKKLVSFDTRADILSPQYGSTRADLRELGETTKPTENSAVGMNIVVTSRDPNAATRAAGLLGDFVGESIFRSQAQGLVARRLEQYESQKLVFENDLLRHNFEIRTTVEKVTSLRALQREFPEASAVASRQVVSVADGGSRYLSPLTQVVGLEATVTDLREKVATTERWRKRAQLLADYYTRAKTVVGSEGEAASVCDALEQLIRQHLAADDEVVREARNEAALDLYALRTLREQGLRFVSGPSPGWRDESRIWKNALAGAALGLALAIAFVLLARALDRRADR